MFHPRSLIAFEFYLQKSLHDQGPFKNKRIVNKQTASQDQENTSVCGGRQGKACYVCALPLTTIMICPGISEKPFTTGVEKPVAL